MHDIIFISTAPRIPLLFYLNIATLTGHLARERPTLKTNLVFIHLFDCHGYTKIFSEKEGASAAPDATGETRMSARALPVRRDSGARRGSDVGAAARAGASGAGVAPPRRRR